MYQHAFSPSKTSPKDGRAPSGGALVSALLLSALIAAGCGSGSDDGGYDEQWNPDLGANHGGTTGMGTGGGTTGMGTGGTTTGTINGAGSGSPTAGFSGSGGTNTWNTGATVTGSDATGGAALGGTTTGIAPGTNAEAGTSGAGASGATDLGSTGAGAGSTGGSFWDLLGGNSGGSQPLDPSVTQPAANKLPQVSGPCPDLRDGATITVNGIRFKLWVGDPTRQGPLVFYWHGTGGSSDEVRALFGIGTGGLGQAVIDEIKREGGIVASADNTSGQGIPTDYGVWATDDFKAADQIVACAIQNNMIDAGRIHQLGFSAGGLAAGTMYWLRSNYLASSAAYSGGTSPWPGTTIDQDPSNKQPIMLFHGGPSDWVVLSFQDQSEDMARKATAAGKPAIVCAHGGGHGIPAAGPRAAWEFFKAHPYNANPDPWASGIPGSVPNYCQYWQ